MGKGEKMENNLKLKFLSVDDAKKVFEIFMATFTQEKVAWVNPPEVVNGKLVHTSGYRDEAKTAEVSVEEALAIYKGKVDGAYTERCQLFLSLLVPIVKNGYNVALIQNQGHDGAPFNSKGWVSIVVERLPIYHIAPWDLNTSSLEQLVTLIPEEEVNNNLICWKETDKVGEAAALFMAASQSKSIQVDLDNKIEIDLVQIAQNLSNIK